MFCGLHVLHNLCIYAEKPLIDWEKNVEEEGTTHASFKKSSNSRTFDLLYEMYKLLSRTHGDQIENYIVFLLHHRFNVVFLLGGGY